MTYHKVLIEGFVTLLLASLLYYSRTFSELILLFLIGYLIFTGYIIYTESISFFFLLSILTALTLSLRIPYLPWGDPWQDYAMIIRTLQIGYPDFWMPHEPGLKSLIAQPLMPAFLALLTVISGQNPMLIQKVVVPVIGATAPVILYWFAREQMCKRIALISALLFLTCTPFIHWLTQPVRETLAIPILFLALWQGYLFLLNNKKINPTHYFLCILILAPLHTFSAFLFLISWYGLSLGTILIQRTSEERSNSAKKSFVIFSVAFFSLILWMVFFNQPYLNTIINGISTLLTVSSPISEIIVFSIFILLTLPYLIIANQTSDNRYMTQLMYTCRRNLALIIRIIQVLGIGTLLITLIFISGHLSFKISYPIPMLIPSMILFIFVLLGLPYVFSRNLIYIVTWLGILSLSFSIGMIKPTLVEDPLRILGYLFAPLCLIAGHGVAYLASEIVKREYLKNSGIILFSAFCTLSLVLAFPAPVFFNSTPLPGDILFDERQYIIEHPESEIKAIEWLADNHQNGTIYTDINIYYASLWMTQSDTIKAEKRPDRLNPQQFNQHENSYVIISDRMFTTAKFGGWVYEKPRPVSIEEYSAIKNVSSIIYEKEGIKIFKKPGILS